MMKSILSSKEELILSEKMTMRMLEAESSSHKTAGMIETSMRELISGDLLPSESMASLFMRMVIPVTAAEMWEIFLIQETVDHLQAPSRLLLPAEMDQFQLLSIISI